jgi:hypothetical protein
MEFATSSNEEEQTFPRHVEQPAASRKVKSATSKRLEASTSRQLVVKQEPTVGDVKLVSRDVIHQV